MQLQLIVMSLLTFCVLLQPIFNRSRVTNQDVFILSNIWGWFVPSLFVGVTCGVDLSIYQRNDNECWMKTNMVLYLVDIPLIIMFIFNLVTYVSVLVASASSQSIRKQTSARNVRQHAILSVCLFVLLGLTWVFGFGIAGSDDSALLFGYLFAVFNSLQGFFIFGLFIVRNKSTRKEITNQVKEGVVMAQQATKDFMSYTNGATNNSYIDNQGDHALSKSISVL
ncbi:adhesion G-protein coupled receptor G2-like isoform X1 [Ciona intestinalis]